MSGTRFRSGTTTQAVILARGLGSRMRADATGETEAGTALDALTNPDLLAQAKADHQARLKRSPYVCPIPDDVTPPIGMSAD